MTVCGFVFFVTLSVFRIFAQLIEISSDKIIGIKLEELEIQGHYKDFWVLTVKSEPSNSWSGNDLLKKYIGITSAVRRHAIGLIR